MENVEHVFLLRPISNYWITEVFLLVGTWLQLFQKESGERLSPGVLKEMYGYGKQTNT